MSENFNFRGLRPGDIAYITSTWMNSFRSNSKWAKDILHRIYSSEHSRAINSVLNSSKVLIACDNSDDDHIYGYIVYNNFDNFDLDVFHYVYIKAPFQKKGVAKNLIESIRTSKRAVFTHKNERASWIPDKLLKDYDSINYNPYLFFSDVGSN